MDQKPVTDEISADFTHQAPKPFLNRTPQWITSLLLLPEEEHDGGSHRVETLHCHDDGESVLTVDDHLSLSNDGLSDLSNSDISLSEVCIASNTKHFEEEMNYEIQQAYRIYSEFMTEKHKVITRPFLYPVGKQETQCEIGGIRIRSQANARQSICLRRMEEKFINKEYETITEFVADFRLMLENCYRYHGVDHWLSKQAQKLEIMLEQKLSLLSRTLREKTTLAVTSKGRFAVGEEQVSTSSTRRRQTPRNLKTLSVGAHESIMVQTLRVEAQQKVKEEKRQREMEKKEADEMSAKEMDEWEKNLLSEASPHNVETLWELPAIGHFLCLAQTALNLPEIVFFELERCLLMPHCSILLSRIMSSLLSPPQRRSTLHRRPVMPYRRWESELRQRVKHWYESIGAAHDQAAQAEQLGLCQQFFSVLGKISPLEIKAFHVLPFYQRIWILKGLCDHVYETQKDIQDAVLAQPIHECRESILGYDSKENAYIHFPHFCGADLRIYCQSPCTSPTVFLTSVLVEKIEILPKLEEDVVTETCEVCGTSLKDKSLKVGMYIQSIDGEESRGKCHSCKPSEQIPSSPTDDYSREELKSDPDTNSAQIAAPYRKRILLTEMEEKTNGFRYKSKRLKEEKETAHSLHFKNESVIQEHSLSIGEHCYTGRSPAGSVTVSALQKIEITSQSTSQDDHISSCCKNKIGSVKLEHCKCCSGSLGRSSQWPSKHVHTSTDESVTDKILARRKEQKKKKNKTLLRMKYKGGASQPDTSKPSVPIRTIAIKRKDEKKKHVQGRAHSHLKKTQEPSQPFFKLVCTNLDDLRELINKTEDELDDLESTKKRWNQWYNRRDAVKDLHSTLIRLLNELTPWEPKLIKAYQRNRQRLKKEFEVFKNHPAYTNFVREECDASLSDDGDVSSLLEQSAHDGPAHILPRGLGGTVKELSTELATESPGTPISYNQQKQSPSSTVAKEDHFNATKHMCKSGLSHHSMTPGHSNSSLTSSELLHTASGKLKNYTPIPTLLAKSVGNKVTLMKQPAYPLKINSERSIVSKQIKINGSSSFPPLNSQEKHKQTSEQSPKPPVMGGVAVPFPVLSRSQTAESLKKSNQVFNAGHTAKTPLASSFNTNQKREDINPQQVVIVPSNIMLHKVDEGLIKSKNCLNSASKMFRVSTPLSGIAIPENTILVQQVPPTKNIDLTDTSSSLSDIPSFLKSQQSARNVTKSKGTLQCGFQTSTSQFRPNDSTITSASSGVSLSTNSKQELKTVCIRESQSILVTTRGGNTGIVKVQKTSDHPSFLSQSPVITISPTFQAYSVPESSVFSCVAANLSDATLGETGSVPTQRHIPLVKSNAGGTTCAKTTSISLSQEVNQSLSPIKDQALTDLSGNTSTNVSKPHSKNITEDNKSQRDKLFLISPPSHGISVCCTRTLPTVTSLTTTKASLQISSATPKQAIITASNQQVMKTSSTQTTFSTLSSVSSLSLLKDKTHLDSSGTCTYTSVQVPCLIANTITQNNADLPQPSKCRDIGHLMSNAAQPVSTNSSVKSRGITVPASPLNSLKYVDISQPVNLTCPTNNSLSATNLKKKHDLSTEIMSSSTSLSMSKAILPSTTQSKCLNSLFIPTVSNDFDKTNSSSLYFPKPQVSCTVPESLKMTECSKGLSIPTTNTSSTAPTGTAQPQMIITSAVPFPSGARFLLNNAHFMVPTQGLGPGSHVFVISGTTPQKLPAKSSKEEALLLNQAPLPCRSAPGQPCVPNMKSFVACTPAVAPSLQATSSIVTAAKLNGPKSTSRMNKTKTEAKCQSLQTANFERTTKETSVFPIINNVLPRASTVLTSASTVVTSFRSEFSTNIATSSASSLANVSPPLSILHKPSTVLIPPFKVDPVQLTETQRASPHTKITPPVPCSSSTSLIHMGHSSLLVQKQEPTVVQPLLDSDQTMREEDPAPSPKNGARKTAAHAQSYGKTTTKCPVIVTPSAMEQHLLQTSFLQTHSPVASELLISPDGAVLSNIQCKIKSTKEQLDV